MKRELGIFPYSPDTFQAPRTTGLIGGTRNTELSLSVPNNETFYTRPKLRGSIMGSYISPTTPCIDTNTTWHPIFAGDF